MVRWIATLALVLATAAPGVAHHGFSRWYDSSKTITLNGTVTKVDWVNPHVFVHIDVVNNGKTEAWALETAGIAVLARTGVTKESLKPGTVIAVSGNPARADADLVGTVPDSEVAARVKASQAAYASKIELTNPVGPK